ncbi:LOW QUALITY PROTEIN: hypothetical protein JCM24511_00896 [Saitozyma sp. JCM 24511]|nr:LOW QUALITY PROTEIN: hypothetical protein JCM24511_00896 [Saitozyma sp. JCM 24511]
MEVMGGRGVGRWSSTRRRRAKGERDCKGGSSANQRDPSDRLTDRKDEPTDTGARTGEGSDRWMPFVRSADAAGAKWMMRGVTLKTASKALSHAGQVDLGDGEG